jgi:uncharacterized membrane protein YfcA
MKDRTYRSRKEVFAISINLHASANRLLATLFFGFLMGTAAGLIGVGGGEFRIPILLYVLGLPVITAIAVNLLVGFLTVVVSFLRRFQLGLLNEGAINIALVMSLGSIVGAYIGAFLTGKIPEKPLKKALAIFLIVVGLKIGLEPFIPTPPLFHFTLNLIEEIILATLVGIVIGIIAGALGVAGGEFRIPALIYLFSFDIIVAGTTSLLVSIPTVAMGFTKHHQMGHTSRCATIIAIVMGAGSILGALIGASYANIIDKDILKVLLGTILILATSRMVTKP